jgi:cellulose 1,4-beta-cellobiosidase
VFLYLPIGAGSFACDDPTRAALARLVSQLLSAAGGSDRIRGFAVNVGTFSPLSGDGARLIRPHNPCRNELDFIERFSAEMDAQGVAGKGFIVDTSRSGQGEAVRHRGHYCNLAAAGLGPRPQAAPWPRIDAYYWVKTPGESDGSDDATAARFISSCASDCALHPAPQGGL